MTEHPQPDRRERYAEALYATLEVSPDRHPWTTLHPFRRAVWYARADAAMAVADEEQRALTADRAVVLREAADHLARQGRAREDATWSDREAELARGWQDAAHELRHLATETGRPVAYGDGKGRVYCPKCPRPTAPVPLTIEDVDHWELCPSCGRHVVDVARDTAAAVVQADGEA